MNTTSIPRQEELIRMCRYDTFGKLNEVGQAKIIAKHYLSHVNVATDLLKACELYETACWTGSNTTELKNMIEYLADLIKQNHKYDLGIELKWNNNEY